jgi:TPP-dependent pyruvate/acetoin dehydrogenase alpha subunit
MNTSAKTRKGIAPSPDAALALYRTMVLVREVEQALSTLFANGEVPGFIHLSLGQEAISAGVASALQPQDSLATTHRGHGHVLARGMAVGGFFKEIMGRAGGLCKGRGGSMHVADLSLGILGANGIVGAGIPIALGSAVAHATRQSGGVAVAFFGDGAMAEGVLHETMNMASLWKSPLLFVCENNGWSEFSPTSRQFAAKLEALAGAFGIAYERVDGNDAIGVAKAAQAATQALREGRGPFVLECITDRVRGHYEGDPQKYRDSAEIEGLAAKDPVARMRAVLEGQGLAAADIESVREQVLAEIQSAIEAARADALPAFEDAVADVYTPAMQGAAA